jgi:uncharacterized phiE125 gp8 family phage protein
MTFKVITAVATEPVTIAEAMAHCRIDESSQEPAPGAITCALASPAIAGNVDNGAHRYLATFVTADGQTQAGTISDVVTVANKSVNGKVSLTGIPLGGALVTSRKLYRTAAGGSTYLLLTTIADNTTTTYTDNIADASMGAEAPSTNTTADPELASIITGAREFAEQYTGRALAPRTLEMALDAFPQPEDDVIQLEMPPVATISSVKYTDTAGVEQTITSTAYALSLYGDARRLAPTYGNYWPTTQDIPDAVRIQYVTGYTTCPKAARQGILLEIQLQYPGNVFTPADRERLEKARDALLNTVKIWGR